MGIKSPMGPRPPRSGASGAGAVSSFSPRFAERSEGGSTPVPGGGGSAAVSLPHGHPDPPGLRWRSGDGAALCGPPPPCSSPSVGRAFPCRWGQQGDMNVPNHWDAPVHRDAFHFKQTAACLSPHTSVRLSRTATSRARAGVHGMAARPCWDRPCPDWPRFCFLVPPAPP